MIRRFLNGETHMSKPHVSIRQSITYGGEPGELKHLSTRRVPLFIAPAFIMLPMFVLLPISVTLLADLT